MQFVCPVWYARGVCLGREKTDPFYVMGQGNEERKPYFRRQCGFLDILNWALIADDLRQPRSRLIVK